MGIVTNGAEPNGPDVGVQKVQVQLGGLVCATHGPKLQESLPSSHAVDSALNSMSAHAPVVLAAPRLQWRHLKICPAASRRRLQVAGILQLRLSLQLFWQHAHGPRPSWHRRPGFQARRSSTLTLEAEAAVPSLALATGPVQGPSDIASDSNAPHLLRHPAAPCEGGASCACSAAGTCNGLSGSPRCLRGAQTGTGSPLPVFDGGMSRHSGAVELQGATRQQPAAIMTPEPLASNWESP